MIVRSSRWFAALCLMLACCTQAATAAAPPVRVVRFLQHPRGHRAPDRRQRSRCCQPDRPGFRCACLRVEPGLGAAPQLFVVNGLGFEGWLTRLTRSAQFGGVVATATDWVTPITTTEPGETSPVPDAGPALRHHLFRQYRPRPGCRRPGACRRLRPKVPNIQSRTGGVGLPRAQRIGRGPSRQAAGNHQP